ncbi:glycosyltransferase family 4 protein [Venenivibrio stagnispumantis]|uniref:Glycosyltransferase involved in cell wall bisynthesis n=1 Tax=Venenivibrio stagnispumantis TaxID=407998 RepID=A0AA46AG84_9AQUI|nr:glycosyltransferase family 4 protein [Venenivibrio stagnispumantis]MCW4573224.1 glycosyltransferase family 4 protein [Venenivibrio stagnispumantis]SMP24283.1 Glycosyltransferase involved in cell wall bisynthesis [Venenivibrio stagnispumantis]
MRTALVHDWLTTIAGAEKVLEAIYELYPSPIYSLVVDKNNLKNTIFENAYIYTSFIQKFPFSKKIYRNYLPFFPLAIEQFDLSKYDVIISSSHAVAKGVLTNHNQLHICYCHTPIRYAWDLYHQYLKESKLERGLKGWIAKYILHKIRIWDISTANRPDYYIANSIYVAKRIKKIYAKEATVIYPPVDIDKFELYTKKEDFYLTASRMVPYKKIDLIVQAFSKMPDKKLVVIGDGPDFKKIKKIATKNIEILGYQPFEVLKDYMKKAKAFIFAAEEDFGIIPVEAQACGTPVIAYGKGGVTETVIQNETGIFFMEQTVDSIINAVKDFEKKENYFDYNKIRKNAEKFSKENFKAKLKEFIENKINERLKI